MAGNDTRPVRYYAYKPEKGKVRIAAPDGMTEAEVIASAQRWGAVNVTREEGPTSNPTTTTVIWSATPGNDRPELDDVDAVLVALILKAEAERPWQGPEAVAARAIVALSRAGMKHDARALLADLIHERN